MRQLHPRALGDEAVAQTVPALAASSVVAVVHVSDAGRIVLANARFARLLGEPDSARLCGLPLRDLLAAGQNAAVLEPGAPGAARRGVEIRLARRDGQIVVLRGDVLTLKSPAAEPTACGVFVDCTELDSLRLALQRSARLEALASLTGGVAHDFNNLLTVLIGNLSLVAEELRDRPAAFAKLKASRDAAARGSDLISQLLGFAGAESVETSVIDPSEVVRKVVPLLSSALGRRVQLKTELDSAAGSIEANAAQLESVIVNLAVNARDAIVGSGTVTVSSSAVVLEAREAHARGLEPGTYIRLCVGDDGQGIPEEWRERVFEPFFSTKKERGGTGLGLSMVRAFGRRIGGVVELESRVGEGTRVCLLLPTSAEGEETGSTQTAPLATLPTGTEHVVLYASDAGVSTTVTQILEVLGYTVTLCTGADELATAATRSRLDLLIVDGAPPRGADGATLVEHVRRRHPGLPWIWMSDTRSGADGGSDAAVLVKPFSLAGLATLVRETLDR